MEIPRKEYRVNQKFFFLCVALGFVKISFVCCFFFRLFCVFLSLFSIN